MDLQFFQFSDALELTGARELPGFLPRTLELHGVDFRSAVEVYINESKSPSFVISSSKVLLAQVPDAVESQPVHSISVLSSEFTATIRSQIRFRIGVNAGKVSGLKSMMQTFLKLLFTTPGTDAFVKRLGGAALRNIGKNFDLGQSSDMVSDFSVAVSQAESQMRALQGYQPRLADDERLLSAKLLNVRFDPATTALIARLELISQSGVRAITNLEL